MSNEPVAWLYRDSWGTLKLSQIMPPPVGAFPVYTHPVDDTALLRQALEALEWHIERGAWGQDLEGLTAALRERLGEKA
jgi:hypothetical protein